MIGYTTLGSNDLTKATAFYRALFASFPEIKEQVWSERFVAYVRGENEPMIVVCTPYNEQEATVGNGEMFALHLQSKEQVDTMHKVALSLGAADDGEPGNRTDTFYGAYFRDLDGHKIAAFSLDHS